MNELSWVFLIAPPFTLTRVLNNSHLYGIAYPLKDLGLLTETNVKGIDILVNALKASFGDCVF